MKDGLLQQVDTPRELYDSPDNAFVAGFIGSPAMNLIDGEIVSGGVQIGSAVLPVPRTLKSSAGSGKVTVGLRPEALELAPSGKGIAAIVNIVEELGSEAFIYAQLADTATSGVTVANDIIARVDPGDPPRHGTKVNLHVKADSLLLFDAESGLRIGK
jgi:multiple sugar transport system ATP-binding protein